MKKRISILLLLTLCLSLAACGGKSGGTKTDAPTPNSVGAKMTKDGTAFIPLADGMCVKINDDVREAYITADRQRVVVLLEDGTLYVTDPKLEKKQTICDDCSSIMRAGDSSIFYKNKSETAFRHLFSDSSTVELGKCSSFVFSPNGATILYATDNKEIWRLNADENEPDKIGGFPYDVYLQTISDDAQFSVWAAEMSVGTQRLVLCNGDEVSPLDSVTARSQETNAAFSKDQNLLFISNTKCNSAWIQRRDSAVVQVRLEACADDWYVYSANGKLPEQEARSVDSLYLSTDADSGSNVYNISMSGDRERVLSGVDDYCISNGRIFYTNSDHTLYCANLDGSNLSEEARIASDVIEFEVTRNGKYVYYMRNCRENSKGPSTASLYCYKVGENEPVKVSDDVSCLYFELINSGLLVINHTVDGSTVYFYKDGESIISGSYFNCHGTLMSWTYGDESPSKISSDVRFYTISSGLSGGVIDPKRFWFQKYASVDSSGNIYSDLMFYNGKEVTKLASDILTSAND